MPEQQPIERGFFREADDGTTVFFPWGLTRRGYQLADESQKKQASRAASFLFSSTIAIGVWVAHAIQPFTESDTAGLTEIFAALGAPGAALFLVIVSYSLWVSRFVERLPESGLKVSREERLREAAELVKPWQVALFGAGVAGISVLCIWLQPRGWWLGLLGVALGAGALYWSTLLKRAGSGSPGRPDFPSRQP